MIGNDIVDLHLAASQASWKRKGFLEKVFTPSERELIEASEIRFLYIWLLWSMKEAAYKAHQRKRSLPRRLNWWLQQCTSVHLRDTSATGLVIIDEDQYHTASSLTLNHIHTIAADHHDLPYEENLFQVPLHHSKRYFLGKISKELDLSEKELRLEKTTSGIPFLSYKSSPLPLSFSFSDHGGFSGFCVSLR